ncbi:aminopeptidase M1-like protein isoform X1, partial [Tanacetum coccineum]
EIQASHIGNNMSNGSKSRIAYLNMMVFIADLLDMVEGAEVDYSTVFIFWQLMFVDNGLAAGMGLYCAQRKHRVLVYQYMENGSLAENGSCLPCLSDCEVTSTDNNDSTLKVFPSKVVADKDDKTLVLVFDEALGVGDGVSEIKFSGVLNEHMKGFYKGCNLYFKNALIF